MKRCGYRRVRQHRHVRRRYLWYAASSAMPTKSTTTARRRMPGRNSMARVYQFDRSGVRSADAREKCSPEKDGAECTNKPERWFRVDGRRDQPADQGDLRRDNDPEPEPEIDELLPEAIEFGHGSLLAPSNVRSNRAQTDPCRTRPSCARPR